MLSDEIKYKVKTSVHNSMEVFTLLLQIC